MTSELAAEVFAITALKWWIRGSAAPVKTRALAALRSDDLDPTQTSVLPKTAISPLTEIALSAVNNTSSMTTALTSHHGARRERVRAPSVLQERPRSSGRATRRARKRAASYYETMPGHPVAPAIIALARALRISSDTLLGLKPLPKGSSSPAPDERRLWKHLRLVAKLPERDQRAVLRLISSVSKSA